MSAMIYKIYLVGKGLIQKLLSWANTRTNKKKRILFYNDELRDNSKALFEYIAGRNEYPTICYTNKKVKYKVVNKNTIYITGLFNLFYYYLTSQVVVCSFDLRFKIKPNRNQKIIQLWHGSPLKTIGNTRKNHVIDRQAANYFTYILCASELFKNPYKQSFGCSDEQIKIWGNPRNDLLFNPLMYEEVTRMFNVHFKKMILWMPTYRQSKALHNREDSTLEIPILNEQNAYEFNKHLQSINALVVIKPHPLQNELKTITNKFSNILILKDQILQDKGYDLYRLVGTADALITDYSSVYFDYLLLDRPIGFTIEDINEYEDKRGFTVTSPEKLMPGSKLYTIDDLKRFANDIVNENDDFSEERNKTLDLTNYYKDNRNCQRIYQDIKFMIDHVNKEV